jgi:hypothetical protein
VSPVTLLYKSLLHTIMESTRNAGPGVNKQQQQRHFHFHRQLSLQYPGTLSLHLSCSLMSEACPLSCISLHSVLTPALMAGG